MIRKKSYYANGVPVTAFVSQSSDIAKVPPFDIQTLKENTEINNTFEINDTLLVDNEIPITLVEKPINEVPITLVEKPIVDTAISNTNTNIIYFKFDNVDLDFKEFTVKGWKDIGFARENLRNLPIGSLSGRLPGIGLGFAFSQSVESMIYYIEHQTRKKQLAWKVNMPVVDDINLERLVFQHIDVENDIPYIIAIAVQYAPSDWTGKDHQGNIREDKKSIFELLNPKYIEDLQKDKALLLIDQSVEGYTTKWLWEWFHKECYRLKINPCNIIYITGDQYSEDSYDIWVQENKPKNKLKIIPSISLSIFVHKHCERVKLKFNFDELLKYKKENPDKIYLYDCLNRRARKQRCINFLHLYAANLLDDGNISMGPLEEWTLWVNVEEERYLYEDLYNAGIPNNLIMEAIKYAKSPGILPRFANHKYDHELNHYFSVVERVCDDLYKHSWVSLVVESSFYDYEANVFISEKTFKPIAAMQPFIIVGSRHTLKYLRKLGYKTFHPYIDESYDDLPDNQRYLGIIESLQKIKAIEDKAAWYESIREIVEYNHDRFNNIGKERAKEHVEIINYYFDHCKKYKDKK